MEQVLTDEQFVLLLDVLEEGDKAFVQASYRDLIMTAHTDMFFELGVRDVATMDAGWKSFKGLQNNFQGKLTSVYSKFRAGTVTTAGATTEFQTLLRRYSKDAFMAGTQMVGNKYYSEIGMTKKDLAFVNKYVRAETRHFRKFLNDIKDPRHLPANKIPRNKLGRIKPGYRQQVHPYAKRIGYYADSLRSMGYNGMVAGAGTLLNIYWVLDKLSGRRSPNCEDCVMIAAGNPYSWQTLSTTPRAGDTQCLFRCYCGLEFQQRKGRGKEFDIPGAGSAQGLQAPNSWARIFDKFGKPIGGAPLQDIEDIYQRMYKARQMIEITRGQEKLNWIRTRQQLNSTLINQYPQYRKIPLVSVRDLTKAVTVARPARGDLLKNLANTASGTKVTLLRGNYFANGKLFLERGQWIFKDATGVELAANLETDVIWKLRPVVKPPAKFVDFVLKAYKENNLSSAQITYLKNTMKFDSVSGKALLKRLGKTRVQVLKKITTARKNMWAGKHSIDIHYNKTTLEWAPKRAAYHDKIVKDYLSKAKSVSDPTFFMTGGRPGSGKSGLFKNMVPGWETEYIVVDSDAIKVLMAKFDGHKTLGFRAALYHKESKMIADRIMELARMQKKNILYDGTMGKIKDTLYHVKKFTKAKYKLKAVFADLPSAEAIERAVSRFYTKNRFVDPAYIMTHGNYNIITFNKIKKYLDEWRHYNTNVPFGVDPILIAKFKKVEKAFKAAVKEATASETYIKKAVIVDGKVSSAAVTKIKKGLLKLPENHLGYLKEIHLQDWPQFSYGGGLPTDLGFYNKRTTKIFIKNIELQTVFHEVGHHIWYKALTTNQRLWWVKQFDLMIAGKINSPSAYGWNGMREFFAECYSYYYNPAAGHAIPKIVKQWFKDSF